MYVLDLKAQIALRTLLYTKSFVFIGYNLGDPPFNVLLDEVAAIGAGSIRPQHWVIMGRPDKPDAKRLWLRENYNIDPVFYEVVDRSHAALTPLLERLAKDVAAYRDETGRLGGMNIIDMVFQDKDKSVTREQAIQRYSQNFHASTKNTSSAIPEPADPTATVRTSLDNQIDAQVELMKAGFHEKAHAAFVAMLDQFPVDGEARLRYRLNANIGHCLLQLDREVEAAPYYIAAYNSSPETTDAKWMFATAAELQGDRTEALARANQLCNDHPEYPRGYMVRARCSPIETSLRSLKRSVPRTIRRDAEVATAFADAAKKRGDLRLGEAYARQAAKASPDWDKALVICGIAIVARVMGGDHPEADYHVVPVDRQRVEEALSYLTKAVELIKHQPSIPAHGLIYVNRAGIRRLLGDDEGAHEDALAAYQADPNDAYVAAKLAHSLEGRGAHDKVIDLFESSSHLRGFIPARFFRLVALYRRKAAGDIESGIDEAKSLLASQELDSSQRDDALSILLNLYLDQNAPDKAIEHLRHTNGDILSPGIRDARLASLLFRYEKDSTQEAISLLREAIIAARSVSPWFARREIAHICAQLRHYRDAADILATIISPKLFSDETERYLDCLFRSKQYIAICEYCRVLRSNSQYTQNALHTECEALLLLDESQEAIDLLGDWLAWRPNDKLERLYQSAIYISRGEPQKATFELSALPTIGELRSPRDGVQAVHVLSHGPNFMQAADYAYNLARQFPDDEIVQFALIDAIMLKKTATSTHVSPDVVDVNFAIILRSVSGEHKRTIKLVSDQVRYNDEYHSTHEVAKTLIGKRLGERITIGGDEMVIESVVPNAALAAREAIETFHIRFPKSKLLQTFRTPKVENPSSVRELLGEEFWNLASADDQSDVKAFAMYQSGEVPLSLIASRRGSRLFELAVHVISNGQLEVMCVPEKAGFIQSALLETAKARTILIDATALASIVMCRMSHLLKAMPFKLLVPETALQELRLAKYDADRGLGADRWGVTGGQFFMNKTSPENMKMWADTLEAVIKDVEAAAEVVGGSARERVVIDHKEQIAKSMGEVGFDAIAIAKERHAVLWTDDQMLGRVAHDLCGVTPIWTQALLHIADLRDRGERRGTVLPELLLYKYRSTFVFIQDIVKAMAKSKWRMSDPRLEGVVKYIRENGCDSRNLKATCDMFAAAWMLASRSDRNKVASMIWQFLDLFETSVAKRRIAKAMYRPHVFPYHKAVPAFRQFRNVFRRWSRRK